MVKELNIECIHGVDEIYEVLQKFDAVFPHLKEKVSSYKEYAEKLNRYANVCICKIEQETCGVLVFYSNDEVSKTAYIALIGIYDKFRGMHIGTFLLEWCKEYILHKGMKKLKLEVDLDNEQAISFYKRKGFVECGEEKKESSMYMITYL